MNPLGVERSEDRSPTPWGIVLQLCDFPTAGILSDISTEAIKVAPSSSAALLVADLAVSSTDNRRSQSHTRVSVLLPGIKNFVYRVYGSQSLVDHLGEDINSATG